MVSSQVSWSATVIPVLGRQRQADLCKVESRLVYIRSSRTAIHSYVEKTISKNQSE